MPPLGASASAEGDGDKKKAAGLGIFWVAYNSLLESQPILAKSLTSMTGFALGDLLAQKFIEKKVGTVAAECFWRSLFGFVAPALTLHGCAMY